MCKYKGGGGGGGCGLCLCFSVNLCVLHYYKVLYEANDHVRAPC